MCKITAFRRERPDMQRPVENWMSGLSKAWQRRVPAALRYVFQSSSSSPSSALRSCPPALSGSPGQYLLPGDGAGLLVFHVKTHQFDHHPSMIHVCYWNPQVRSRLGFLRGMGLEAPRDRASNSAISKLSVMCGSPPICGWLVVGMAMRSRATIENVALRHKEHHARPRSVFARPRSSTN